MGKAVTYKTPSRGLDLSPQRSRWLEIYVETGDHITATVLAGFKAKDPSAYGRKLVRELAPIIEQAVLHRLAELEPVALARMDGLSESAKSEQVRFQATRDILDRSRLMRGEKRVHEISSEGELFARLAEILGSKERARELMGQEYVLPAGEYSIEAAD